MKKLIILLSVLFIFIQPLLSQADVERYISVDYSNKSFREFTDDIESRYNIKIFFNQDWVKDISISLKSDSIGIRDLLDTVLQPYGVNYFVRSTEQIFLSGSKIIKNNSVETVDPLPATEINNKAQWLNTKKVSYENRVSSYAIGSIDKMSSTGISILSGRVRSESSGEPVIGATIIVKGTNNGVITDSDGFYALKLDKPETVTIDVSCLGMESLSFHITLKSSGNFDFELKEKLIDIQEVVVRSGKHDNVRGIQMGFQQLAVKEIKNIPAVMGERDILKVANMLPGVQTVREGASGFHVRGSSSDQNLFLLNEIPIYNTGHLFGFFSAFNPEMINDFNLYKSYFPAEYGGRIASVFDISTKKGNKKKFGAKGAISPVTGSMMLEVPIVKEKASFIIGGRSTYSDWILNRIDYPEISNSNASFNDLMAGVHITNNNRSSIQAFGYMSNDKFTLAQTNSYKYNNTGGSIIYDRQLNQKWKIEIAGIGSKYTNYHSNNPSPSKASEQEFTVIHNELKTKLTGFLYANHNISGGANIIFHKMDHGQLLPAGKMSQIAIKDFGKEFGLEYAIFASDEYNINDKLTLYSGLRYSSFNLIGPGEVLKYENSMPIESENVVDTITYTKGESITNYNGPEFRFSLNYQIEPDLSMKVSYNRSRQYIFMLSNTISISPTDRWKMVDPHIVPPVADQISFGIYRNINRKALETSFELYYKKTNDIVEYKDGALLASNPDFETTILQGKQNSYGIEFLIKRNAGRLTGWMSYSWARSFIKVDHKEIWGEINDGDWYAANYDKPHSINLIGSYSLSRRLNLSANLVYSTGRPITYPTGMFMVNGIQGISYSKRNEFRISDYFRIDMSLNFEGNLLKDKVAHGSWMFSVYNITGRNNVYSVYFKSEGGLVKGYKQSIYGVPIFTISYNIKLGNYAVE